MGRRILKRIVFINIANSDYSSAEIAGNACFVGTNNMGKTTLQRAILFFYTANSRGLGIAGSERPFEDYYFQFPNSYIVYEVETEEGDYHILTYRNNKINYRFIDAPYEKDLYIRNSEALSLREILAEMNQRRMVFTDQIETFEKYRNILYGTDPDKKYKRFALLKGNHQYHNIPLAISSIFLSYQSVVKSEFVKDCIANSINAKNTSIELKTVERQLRQFTEKYQDIETFFKKENVQKGVQIRDNFTLLRNIREGQKELAIELGGALRYAVKQKSEIENWLTAKREEAVELSKAFEGKESEFKNAQTTLDQRMGVIKNKLEERERRAKKYAGKNMEQLMTEAAKKDAHGIELKSSEDQYAVLLSGFTDVEQTYNTMIAQLENEKRSLELEFAGKSLAEEKRLNESRIELLNALAKEKDKVSEAFNKQLDSLQKLVHEKQLQLSGVQNEEKLVRNGRFFEEEINLLKEKISSHYVQAQKRNSSLEISDAAVSQLNKEAKMMEDNYKMRLQNETQKVQEKTQKIKEKIIAIQSKLSIHKETLFGFLNEHKPDWADTIGKVCQEDILFSKELKPHMLDQLGASLYGIGLDLTGIRVSSKTVEEYEKEKTAAEEEITSINSSLLEMKEQWAIEEQNELAVVAKKIREHKKIISKIDYENQLEENKEKALLLDMKEWENKAMAEKEKRLLEILEKETVISKEVQDFKVQVQQVSADRSAALKASETTYKDKIDELAAMLTKFQKNVEKEKKELEQKYNSRTENLKKEKSKVLKEKGLDTGRLEQLRTSVEQLKKLLKKVEENTDLLAEYRIDRKEYLDRQEEFEKEKEKCTADLDAIKKNFKEMKAAFQKQEEAFSKAIREKNKELQQHVNGLQYFDQHFRGRSLYDRLSKYIEDETSVHSVSDITDLCSRIIANDNEYHQQFNHFKSYVTEFVGRFRQENHLGFKVSQESDFGYEGFANYLNDFLNENRIQTSIAEVAKSHGMLIDTIANKVKSLTDQKGKISKIIGKMESDFSKAEFESSRLIEFIKLKTEDSENKVLKKLQKIFDFRESNDFMYGETNLFTHESKNKSSIDRKSVELLHDLQKTITEENYEEIRVQDLFELKFRVKENKNDTGWVEKIEKVGSTGTDILVKAIIYITLLNVFIKESTEKTGQNFKVHCIIDEVGQISAPYLKELIAFAESRDIYLINGLPNESKLETFYNYTYKFKRFDNGHVRVIPLLTVSVEV